MRRRYKMIGRGKKYTLDDAIIALGLLFKRHNVSFEVNYNVLELSAEDCLAIVHRYEMAGRVLKTYGFKLVLA